MTVTRAENSYWSVASPHPFHQSACVTLFPVFGVAFSAAYHSVFFSLIVCPPRLTVRGIPARSIHFQSLRDSLPSRFASCVSCISRLFCFCVFLFTMAPTTVSATISATISAYQHTLRGKPFMPRRMGERCSAPAVFLTSSSSPSSSLTTPCPLSEGCAASSQ